MISKRRLNSIKKHLDLIKNPYPAGLLYYTGCRLVAPEAPVALWLPPGRSGSSSSPDYRDDPPPGSLVAAWSLGKILKSQAGSKMVDETDESKHLIR